MRTHNTAMIRILGTLAVCALLLLPGCGNPMDPQDTSTGKTVETGTLSLTLDRWDIGRTIMPGITRHDFAGFILDFTSVCVVYGIGNTTISVSHTADFFADGGTVELHAGIWDLRVTAFLEGGEGGLSEAARGTLKGIDVPPGGTVEARVTLAPITTGIGTFAWNIGFDGSITAAQMEITLLDETPPPGLSLIPLVVDGTPSIENNPGSVELYAGRYRVVFTLYNDRGERTGISEVLHVYRNMESGFAGTFGPGHFPSTLLDYILETWDGTRWNLAEAGITAWHFSFAGVGIAGIYDNNFDDIVPWFDRLSAATASTDGTGLRALADAALVGMGTDAGFTTAAVYRLAVQSAIEALAVNGSALVFRWEAGYETLVVDIGTVHAVEIDFGRPLPLLPLLDGTVRISGTARVGQTLAADTADLGGSGTVSFQWYRGTAPIPGAVGPIYVVHVDDVGHAIMVRATRAGNLGSVVSGLTGVIFPPPDPARFAWVEGGTFLMGSNPGGNVTPMRNVTLSSFYMSRFQVTQGEWYDVMGTWPSFFTGTNRYGTGELVGGVFDRRNLPVERVSWYDAIVFANRLSLARGLTPAYELPNVWPNPTSWSSDPGTWGSVPTISRNALWDNVRKVSGSTGYRLPTEAQWEFAAR